LRLVCAPDSLKGVLAAPAAAGALAAGARRAGADAVEVPLADGGEGTAAVLQAAWGGEWRTASVADPLGRVREARFLFVDERELAVIESAEAIGLPLLEPEERDPLRTSSEGLAHLINAALDAGARGLIIAIGGSATVDGGVGLMRALPADSVESVPMRVLCDVSNVLHGSRGAARAFGPQKGATPAQVEELERRLHGLRALEPFAELPGAGAAGGLGAALASLGAELSPGADAVLEIVEFDRQLEDADLAITGEGAVDATSLEGKVPAAVATACARAGVASIVFGGIVTNDAAGLYELGATAVVRLSGQTAQAAADLEELGFGAARLARALSA
jgi:glycerate kinase